MEHFAGLDVSVKETSVCIVDDTGRIVREVKVANAMKRVAVFGNAGGGKSTLARQLAEITGLPLHIVDMLQFRQGGAAVPHDEYVASHRALLGQDTWIIDGYGDTATAWERFGRADTLVYVDLPLPVHYWRVTKRLIKGLFADPEGWPEDSPLWSSTLSSSQGHIGSAIDV